MRRAASGDVLPDCLVHKIFSYLTSKETAQMRIVSKTWQHAWFMTRPNLNFTIYSGKDIRKVDRIMETYRDRRIPIDEFELRSYRQFDSREWIDKWLGIALQNGVKVIVCRVDGFSYSIPIWTILASKSLRVLQLRGCDLTRVSKLSTSSGGVVNCDSLRHLFLSYVRLDDNMLRALLNRCPLIASFSLSYCVGLKTIEMRNLQKITSVSIWTNRNHHIKIQECKDLKYRVSRWGDISLIKSETEN